VAPPIDENTNLRFDLSEQTCRNRLRNFRKKVFCDAWKLPVSPGYGHYLLEPSKLTFLSLIAIKSPYTVGFAVKLLGRYFSSPRNGFFEALERAEYVERFTLCLLLYETVGFDLIGWNSERCWSTYSISSATYTCFQTKKRSKSNKGFECIRINSKFLSKFFYSDEFLMHFEITNICVNRAKSPWLEGSNP